MGRLSTPPSNSSKHRSQNIDLEQCHFWRVRFTRVILPVRSAPDDQVFISIPASGITLFTYA